MAHVSFVIGDSIYPVTELSITETAMRGYEWSARVITDDNNLSIFNPENMVRIELFDGNTSMSFPDFVTLRAIADPNGTIELSGMDNVTWHLSRDIDADTYDDEDETSVYNSSSVHEMRSIVAEICSKCGVSLDYSGSTVYMYGLGTLTGTGVSLLDRVLGLFNWEWRVSEKNKIIVRPLVWNIPENNSAKTVPLLSASRHRDFEQRKTSMAFSKILSLPSYSEISASNQSSTILGAETLQNPNAQAESGYPSDRFIDPFTLAQVSLHVPVTYIYFNQASALGSEYTYIELVSLNDADGGWKLALYNGDPGTDENPGDGKKIAELYGSGTHSTASTTKDQPFTHARLYHTVTWTNTVGTSVTVDEYPHVDGIKAQLRCFAQKPDLQQQSFTYIYDSGKTPINPDANIVSDVLWKDKAQCIELAPGQMWTDNRQSHTIDYSGPLVLGLHVADIIEHHIFPMARIDQLTYSLSESGCTTTLQCAVLGEEQW